MNINIVRTEEEETSEESKEENEEEEHTSAYINIQVENKVIIIVVDTGSDIFIISKLLLDQLSWNIEASTKLHMIVADNYKLVPLGKIFNILIKITRATVGINMIIINTTSYEVVLRNEFLKKVQITIDFNIE